MSESGTSSGFRDFDVAGFVNNLVSAFVSIPSLSSVCSWCSKNGESRIIVCDALTSLACLLVVLLRFFIVYWSWTAAVFHAD